MPSKDPAQPSKKDARSEPSRRGFLQLAGAAAAFGAVMSAGARKALAETIPASAHDTAKFTAGPVAKWTAASYSKVLGANDRVNFAVVGVGGQGFGAHVKGLIKNAKDNNIEVIGIADCYKPRIERAQNEAKKAFERDIQGSQDYRKLLENKDIDAVVVATPEHWHAQIGVHTMQSGRPVYIEKPLTRYLDEAIQLMNVSKETGKLCQLGAQYSSDPKWKAIGKAIQDGKIGPLVTGQDSYCRNAGKKGEWNYNIEASAGPDNLDWETWLGGCPKRPWDDDAKARFFRYRKYWDYSAGILGDLAPHRLAPLMIGCGNPEFPVRVNAIGTQAISKDREVDDSVIITAEFPSGWTLIFTGSTVNQVGLTPSFRGHKGTIVFGGEGASLKPEQMFATEVDPEEIAKPSGAGVNEHHRNFIRAIRGQEPSNCDVVLATKLQAVISLAEMSSRTKKTMLYDEKTHTWTAS